MSHDKHVAPVFEGKGFTCPFCDFTSNFVWEGLITYRRGNPQHTGIKWAICSHCDSSTIWIDNGDGTGKMIWPLNVSTAPLPNPDMPVDIQADYNEARSISAASPRGAAALLRLSIQKLCMHLGEQGKNINEDIGSLVSKGLPVEIQQALDVVRVIGNNAVHPGDMQVKEEPETVSLLFRLVNLIVDNRITQPKAVSELYAKLPKGITDAIAKRDKK